MKKMNKIWHWIFSTLFLIIVIPLMIIKPSTNIWGVEFDTTDLIILSLVVSMVQNSMYWFEILEEKIRDKQ